MIATPRVVGPHKLPVRQGSPEARFWTKVAQTDTDCWEWTGHREANGYGRFYLNGRMRWAHRAIWELTVGPIPAGLDVCHSCDNRACVLPMHLFLGTRAENVHDCIAKRRHNFGERSGTAKLTDAKVRDIRARYAAGGIYIREIASAYGVSETAIKLAIRRKRWAHVDAGGAA
jgi:hypothetical protein